MAKHKEVVDTLLLRVSPPPQDAPPGGGGGGGVIGAGGGGPPLVVSLSRASLDDRMLLVTLCVFPPKKGLLAGASCRFERSPSLVFHTPHSLLHCADLCNPLLPHDLSRRIAGDLAAEFTAQAHAEAAAGLPVTVPTCAAGDAAAAARLECGFIDFVVAPLFRALALVDQSLGSACLCRVAANRAAWGAAAAAGGGVGGERAGRGGSRASGGDDDPPSHRSSA